MPTPAETHLLDLGGAPTELLTTSGSWYEAPETLRAAGGAFLELPAERDRLGDWELIERLGQGGMGVVWRARDATGREAAIKVERFPRALRADDPPSALIDEYTALARCDSPFVIGAEGVGRADGRDYLVLELVSGPSLADWIADAPAPTCAADWIERARLAIDVARALEHVHARGLLHRDLKPGNVLLDERGRPRLIDFGLASEIGEPAADEEPGVIAIHGTPQYMSPEQARNQRLDARSDVYALGALLYELLTGRPAIDGRTNVEIMRRLATEPVRDPRLVAPSVPAELAELCLKACAFDRDRRIVSARALAIALTRVCRDLEREEKRRERWALTATGRRRLAELSAAGIVAVSMAGLPAG